MGVQAARKMSVVEMCTGRSKVVNLRNRWSKMCKLEGRKQAQSNGSRQIYLLLIQDIAPSKQEQDEVAVVSVQSKQVVRNNR